MGEEWVCDGCARGGEGGEGHGKGVEGRWKGGVMGVQGVCEGGALGVQRACGGCVTVGQWVCNGCATGSANGVQWVCNGSAMGAQSLRGGGGGGACKERELSVQRPSKAAGGAAQ